ncbi:LysM peptidoglycan-binding domain-containing M23 family metallopeptidase [Brevibacillus sp. B_LB10_24]|uniref:LysM peptidoglycan-binding domain-containing M23 family metallopeptidase n=1 Tax=Brevibacillus sp. B_LB10_24 TaxID=3380645 RepID=UPI0038B724D3
MGLAEWKAWLKQRLKPIYTGDKTKKIGERVSTYISKHKKAVIWSSSAAVACLAVGVSATYYYESHIIPIYHVVVNGKEVGIVNDTEIVQKWAEEQLKKEQSKKNGAPLKLSDYISFTQEMVYKGKYDNEATLAALAKEAQIRVDAVKISVDGTVIGYAANQAEANEALNRIKKKYAGDAVEDKNYTVSAASVKMAADSPKKQVKFKENVATDEGSVPVAQVLTVDKLTDLLSKGTLKQEVHTVKEGDCITCIAKQYGITSKDIYANNPGVTEDTLLQLGQKLNVTATRSLVTVQVTEEKEQTETIDYSTETKNNDQLPKGETKIIQQGKEGKKLVRYQIVMENGQEVSKEVIDEKVLEKPVTKIVERGTKVIPSRGTGRLSWPAKGYISSGFGMRWGRMHKGIDIAGSGSVLAADNGRVTLAGWDGDYGNSVVIDHGNGMTTRYGHMKSISVKVGDVVSKGKKIGVMGSTGDSTGVHLHFEVHKDGKLMNPLSYLK